MSGHGWATLISVLKIGDRQLVQVKMCFHDRTTFNLFHMEVPRPVRFPRFDSCGGAFAGYRWFFGPFI